MVPGCGGGQQAGTDEDREDTIDTIRDDAAHDVGAEHAVCEVRVEVLNESECEWKEHLGAGG